MQTISDNVIIYNGEKFNATEEFTVDSITDRKLYSDFSSSSDQRKSFSTLEDPELYSYILTVMRKENVEKIELSAGPTLPNSPDEKKKEEAITLMHRGKIGEASIYRLYCKITKTDGSQQYL